MKKYLIVVLFLGLKSFSQTDIDNQTKGNLIENDTVKNKKEREIETVIVTNKKEKAAISIGKSEILAKDLPQATAIIGKDIIAKQQILRLSDVMKNTNGVYVSGNNTASGNNQEELGARGFSFSGANTFKNGVRFNGSLIPEAASLESIEVLKGSSALLYGNVSPGGLLNLVSKKPQFYSGGEVNFRLSEYGFYKPTLDLYGSVDNSNVLAFRIITSAEKSNSFRDVVQSERVYINPSLLFDISSKTNLLIEADFLKDSRTLDFGLPAINYEISNLHRNTFIGFDWSKFNSQQESLTATLTHQFNDNWKLKTVLSQQNYNTHLLGNLRPNSGINFPISATNLFTNLVQSNGNLTRGVQQVKVDNKYTFAEINLNGNFKSGTINHTFLLGADADDAFTNTLNYASINNFDMINIYNPTVVISKNPIYANTQIPEMTKATNLYAGNKRAGVFVQDLITLTEKFKVLAGLRYSYIETNANTLTFSTNKNVITKTTDNIVNSKLGLVYQPTKTNTFFASYADSFVLNTGTDRFLNGLPASTINQYELGTKNEFFKGFLQANATFYLIDFSNLAQTDFTNGNVNTNIKELAGSYESKGVELDVTGNLKNLKIIAGYSFNETKYTKSNIFDVGTVLRYTPKNTANLSAFYTLNFTKLKGLEFGIQNNYVGGILGGRLRPNNASTFAELARKPIEVAAFFTTDLSLGYTFKGFNIRTKITNLANKLSYYVYDDNTITPLAPRMLTTTITYKF